MTRLTICAGDSIRSDAEFTVTTPPWQGGEAGEAAELRCCCQSILAQAAAHSLHSIALCPCSIDQSGYPPVPAATVILRAIMDFLADHFLPEQVCIVCNTAATAAVYRQTYNLWYAMDKEQRL